MRDAMTVALRDEQRTSCASTVNTPPTEMPPPDPLGSGAGYRAGRAQRSLTEIGPWSSVLDSTLWSTVTVASRAATTPAPQSVTPGLLSSVALEPLLFYLAVDSTAARRQVRPT